jgi:enamine deaminase RidA (YjgF/YER057c/UK114 family)
VVTAGLGERAAAQLALVDDWSAVTRIRELVPRDRLDEYPELAQARREATGLWNPTVMTTVVEQLFGEEPLIEISAAGPGDAVHLPTILPVDEAGEVVAPGDFRGQYTWCLEQTGRLLEGLGLTLAHLVQTIDFSTPATRDVYRRCGRPRMELLGPVYPGAAGILVERLPHPDVLVAFEMVASRSLPEAVNPGWTRYETLTYNPAVRAGGVLYGSGFAALDPVTQEAVHAGDAKAQSAFTYGSIAQVLAAAGAGSEHLVQIDEYVTPAGVPDRSAISGGRDAALPGSTAHVTSVGCATLLRPEFLLEAIPTAVLPA